MIDKWLKTVLAIIAFFLFLALCNPQARAENPWRLGTGIDCLAGTAISLASTLIFTLQDLGFDNRRENDNLNIGLLFGFHFQP